MIAQVLLFIATVSVHVAGLELEATDGQDITIPFGTVKLERVDEVKVIFAGEDKKKSLIARYCSCGDTVPRCKPVKTDAVSLQVEERNVSLILQDVNISRSGLYKAQAFFGKQVREVNATLVVNKPPFSSSRAPPHTSTLKPPNSSKLQGLLIAAAIIIIIIIIIIIFCFFCKWRRNVSQQRMLKKTQKPLLSPDPMSAKERNWESNSSDCVAVSMNSCSENTEDLHADT